MSDKPTLPPPRQAGHYRCIVIDPPWDQGKTGKRTARPNQGTRLDYETMAQGELADMPIAEWAAPQSFLWLWATNSRSKSSGRPILMQAFELMETWGFRYYTMVTWDKRTGPCPFGPYQVTTEHCLFGYRGKMPTEGVKMGQLQTGFAAPVTAHSAKPSSFYDALRGVFSGPRLDVFARAPHPGFDGWGLEYEEPAPSSQEALL